jgi:hypothetical protein
MLKEEEIERWWRGAWLCAYASIPILPLSIWLLVRLFIQLIRYCYGWKSVKKSHFKSSEWVSQFLRVSVSFLTFSGILRKVAWVAN